MISRLFRLRFVLSAAIILTDGCAMGAPHSPTVDVIGSYFPAWMFCMIVGIVLTVVVRLLLIGLTLHPHVRFKPLVYTCMVVLFTAVIWLMYFKN